MGSLANLQFPARTVKPRSVGVTAIIDAGPDGRGWLGLRGQEDLLEAAAPCIDYAKIWAASAATLPESLVRTKVALYNRYGVRAFTGGILFEIAWLQNRTDDFYAGVVSLGFTHVEISENYVELTPAQRESVVRRARSEGLAVLYEYGRKHPGGASEARHLVETVKAMLTLGVERVILEQGEIDALLEAGPQHLAAVVSAVGPQHLLLEVSQTEVPGHAVRLLQVLGPEANLANVLAGDLVRLEHFRLGLGRAIDFPFVANGARCHL